LYSRIEANASIFILHNSFCIAGNEVNWDHLKRKRALGGVHMNPVLVLNERTETNPAHKATQSSASSLDSETLLIATIDQDIRAALAELLESAGVKGLWVSSVKEVKALIARQPISACLCGFWLQDGTYREIIRHLRKERMDIPAIIVSTPTCPQEFRDYLAAMNLGALDVLSYPYEQSDFERMLEVAIPSRSSSISQHQPSGKTSSFEVRGAA
jgi:CheY-like chemotaxis protein